MTFLEKIIYAWSNNLTCESQFQEYDWDLIILWLNKLISPELRFGIPPAQSPLESLPPNTLKPQVFRSMSWEKHKNYWAWKLLKSMPIADLLTRSGP